MADYTDEKRSKKDHKRQLLKRCKQNFSPKIVNKGGATKFQLLRTNLHLKEEVTFDMFQFQFNIQFQFNLTYGTFKVHCKKMFLC